MYSIFFKYIFLNYLNRYVMLDSLCGLLKIELIERYFFVRSDNSVVVLFFFLMKVRVFF